MISTENPPKLEVVSAKNAGPYVVVPVTQLADVCRLLDAHQVEYDVDDTTYQLENDPEVTFVNFARDADSAAIQVLFDQAS